MTFSTAAICEAGGRETNQDRWAHQSSGSAYCWVVADGLGGMGGGEIAAEAATKALASGFVANPECSRSALQTHLESANQAILGAQQTHPLRGAMRTTVAALLAAGKTAVWAHSGDSRLYYLHEGAIVHQTLDHSVPQALVSGGELPAAAIRFHPDRNRLLKSLGTPQVAATFGEAASGIAAGDAFLLASDGFWEFVTETEMEVEFAKATGPGEWLQGLLRRFRTRASGDHDNYTAVAVFVG